MTVGANKISNWALAALALGLVSLVPAAGAADGRVVEGTTAPSATRELALPVMGIVAEVKVKEGDPVKKGQVLLQMDDVVEQKQLEAAQTRADIREEIRAREADLKVKAIQFERTKEAKANGAATQAEYDQREAEKVQAEIAIDRQKHEGKIAEADAAVAAQRIKQMKLVSPIDGFVQRIDNDEGEGVDPQRPVMVVVQLDPLDVEIKSLTSDEVAGLRLGQGVKVRYRGENDWVDAKVKFISPVIDARSGTQVIKLALPNPKNTYAGRQVEVQLPSNVAAGSAGGGADAAAAR